MTGRAARLTVGIPLISQKVSPDWAMSCRLLEQTLASIANQSLACDRVLIACHETPAVKVPAGLDVEFIEVKFDYPRYTLDGAVDQYRKKEEIGARHRRYGGGRLFFLDADDLIDRDFVAAMSRIEAKAIVMRRGYQARLRPEDEPRSCRGSGGAAAVAPWSIGRLTNCPRRLTRKRDRLCATFSMCGTMTGQASSMREVGRRPSSTNRW